MHALTALLSVAISVTLWAFSGVLLEQAAEKPAAEVEQKFDPLRQPGDDVLRVLPRDGDSEERKAALAFFMQGRLFEKRGRFKEALAAYQEAIERDPNIVQIYDALIPLAFRLNQTELGFQYAQKAVELNPDNYELLSRLALNAARQAQIEEAIDYFQKALASESLDRESPIFVSLHREFARLLVLTNRLELAEESFKVLLDAFENSSKYRLDPRQKARVFANPYDLLENMGQTFLVTEEYELAEKVFRLAAKTDRRRENILNYNLARVDVRREDFKAALDKLATYFEGRRKVTGPGPYRLLSEIFVAQERADEFLEYLQGLSKTEGKNRDYQLFLADEYLKADRLGDAETIFSEIADDSESIDALIGLARISRIRKEPGPLLDAFTRAFETGSGTGRLEAELELIGNDDELVDKLIQLGRELVADDNDAFSFVHSYLLSKLAVRAERVDDAVFFYDETLAKQPRPNLLLYREYGLFLLDEDLSKRAVEVFTEALDEPSFTQQRPVLFYLLSQAWVSGDNFAKALEAIKEARSIEPANSAWHFQEGWIHARAKDWDEAIRVFEEIVAGYPDDIAIVRQAQFNLSNVYVQKGDLRRGEQVLEEVYEEDPDNISVNNDLGYLYADAGKNLEQARKMIQKALDAEPENPAYLDSMGWVLYRLGEFEEAIDFLRKAVEIDEDADTVIWDHLADCQFALKRFEEARVSWEKALEAAEGSATADEELLGKIREKLKDLPKDETNPKPPEPPVAVPTKE